MSTVKFIHSNMTGAPALTGQAGALISVLDAALVNGFGAATVDSLVIAGGIATVTRGAGHPFSVSEVAQIGGATVTGGSVNGDKIVLSVTATQYTFAATGIPNQTATGTITHKVAPLGWSKAFSGTNLAAYRSTDITGTQLYLRVDDTGTTDARVVGYETMTDVNSGTGPFPTSAQQSGGAYWAKSNTANSTARPWAVVGDTRGFYLWTDPRSANITGMMATFGDFASRKSPDPWACSLSGNTTAAPSAAITSDMAYSNQSAVSPHWGARGTAGLGSSAQFNRTALSSLQTGTGRYSGDGASNTPVYPNPADNALLVSSMYLLESGSAPCLRGLLPGFYFACNNIGALVFSDFDRITGVTGLSGRTLRALRNPSGVAFVDVTGPWAR